MNASRRSRISLQRSVSSKSMPANLQGPVEHVAQDAHDLLGLAGDGQRGAVDLLERVVVLGWVQGDQRLAERAGEARVEGGVPLAVLLAEAHDDSVGLADQRARADRVDARAERVAEERLARLA